MYAEVNGKLNYAKGLNSNNFNSSYSQSSNKYSSSSSNEFLNYVKTQNISTKNDDYYCGGKSSLALRGLQINNSPVSIEYFSNKNIAKIQKCIKKEILKKSNGEYILDTDQDETDLILVMRAVYLEYSRNLPNNISEQVSELNRYTLREIIPGMITNIEHQIGYIRDISQPIQPISLPVNVNNGGRRTLPSVTSLW
jgi:hypothetical protein